MGEIIGSLLLLYCLLNILCIKNILIISVELFCDFKLAIKDFTVLDIIYVIIFLPLIIVFIILTTVLYIIDNIQELKVFKILYKKPFKDIDKK